MTDCPCLAADMEKIWAVYWALGGATSIPPSWPAELSTSYNADTPLTLPSLPEVFLSSSPAPFCPSGREIDIAAILKAIDNAEKFVEIAVMDYIPATLYTHPMEFWPDIDDALRRAAINRGVRVRLLTSHWAHTRPAIARFLRSLADLSGSNPKVDIEVLWEKICVCSDPFCSVGQGVHCAFIHPSPGKDPLCSGESQQVHGD